MKLTSTIFIKAAALLAVQAMGSVAMSREARAMMEDSMAWMDNFYDPKIGQLFDLESKAAMNHETLTSAWYAVGLLARNGNKGKDKSAAEAIISYIIADQFDNPKDLWYGDYTREPEEPAVGSAVYPARAYGSWDPNWRGFVGLSFITMYEDFGHLLSKPLKDLMLQSLHNCSIGDSYRGGGVNNDNLYPSYSNPAIMRAIGTGWTGRHTGDENMTTAGENYAKEIIELWDMHQTLSEFNSATYTGISLFGLTLWCKYMPKDSIMAQRGPDMLRGVWNTTAQLWHADMRNLAGPWDRSYSFDMTIHLGHLALFLTPIIGREKASLRQHPETMSHARDWAWAPLIAVHSDFHNSLLSNKLKDSLKSFRRERTWVGQAYYPPYDLESRNITTWLDKKLMIGAQSYRTRSRNGPSNNNGQFHPAVAQWMYRDGKIGWLSLRSSQAHVKFEVSPRRLKITYPDGGADSVFTFYVSPSLRQRNVKTWADIQGISISVSGNVDEAYDVKFAGRYGGAYGAYYDHNYWWFQHKMPAGFEGTPELIIDFAPES
ncbi:hypothetical protein F4779DRAFT_275955 [Xylariaceae sp. FL0662B]|nr:hypothetical protein F4779DRAFT_275955 [Xylariaceae sp. FL0662B]